MPMCSSQTIRSPGCGVLRAGGDRLAGALRPGPHVVDAAEALAGVAERRAGLAGGPGDEVRAPRADAGAGGGLAVLRDPRRVVGAGRLLGRRRPPGAARLTIAWPAGGAAGRRQRGRAGRRSAGQAGARARERRSCAAKPRSPSVATARRRRRAGCGGASSALQLRDAAGEWPPRLIATASRRRSSLARDLRGATSTHCCGGDLRAAVLGDVRLGGGADAAAQLASSATSSRRISPISAGVRGVEAGDAVLDLGVDVRVARSAGCPSGARLEPAQVALAAEEVVVAGRRERDVVVASSTPGRPRAR